MLEAVFKDRVRDIELTYEGSEMLTQDGYTTLVIRQKDNYYPLAVTEYIRVLPEYDLLEKWVEIKNTGKKGNMEIENAQSGTFFLPKNAYELTHLSGRWGYEYQMNVTKLTQGLKTIQTKDCLLYTSTCWETSMQQDDTFPTVLRNLSLAYFNKLNRQEEAVTLLEKAFALDMTDARILMELDQLYKRLNRSHEDRLAFLKKHKDIAFQRDDLYLEYVTLLNQLGQYEEAIRMIDARKFHPWEGGEGKVPAQ